jgi:ribose transport system ATP-binding protein
VAADEVAGAWTTIGAGGGKMSPPPAPGPSCPTLSLRHVSKRFPGQLALDDVNLDLGPGEVHALVGQNGSGKSTLIKILAGFHDPEPGAMAWLRGTPIDLSSPGWPAQAGVRFIHQDLALIPTLSAIDNLALVEGYRNRWWISGRKEAVIHGRELERWGVDVDASIPVGMLTQEEQTMVAIVRALHGSEHGERILILDEPTAALPRSDVERLFAAIRSVRGRGGAILYVSHRLGEVFELADRVSVLRDGKLVDSGPIGDFDHERLVEAMVGFPLADVYPELPPSRPETVLRVENLQGRLLRGVSFSAHRGEVLGIAGLTGSGREELPYLLFGAVPRAAGRIELAGELLDRLDPPTAIEKGIALVPSDRARRGIVAEFTVRENLTLPRLPVRGLHRWLSVRAERRLAAEWMSRLDVRPRDSERPIKMLSGGNQQKVVLGRWLRCEPKLLLLDEPVQGVDVGAKAAIFQAFADAVAEGTSIIVCSNDADDLASVCDRVLVIADGVIVAELEGATLTAEQLVHYSLTS